MESNTSRIIFPISSIVARPNELIHFQYKSRGYYYNSVDWKWIHKSYISGLCFFLMMWYYLYLVCILSWRCSPGIQEQMMGPSLVARPSGPQAHLLRPSPLQLSLFPASVDFEVRLVLLSNHHIAHMEFDEERRNSWEFIVRNVSLTIHF